MDFPSHLSIVTKRYQLLCCLWIALLCGSCASVYEFFGLDTPVSPVPTRPADAMGGRAFMEQTSHLSPDAREEAILREILRGNTPAFVWKLKPVRLTWYEHGKVQYRGRIWVTSDYLAIGSEDDFIRIPMTPMTAQKIASRFGYSLPTRKIVDEIYAQAEVRVKPQPLKAGPLMVTNGYYQLHQSMIEKQLGRSHGKLIAGHKKDVVLSNILMRRPHRVAIYGWHTSPKRPIQPLSIFHIDSYADYSHGIRLVWHEMEVNGKKMPLAQVLRDPVLSKLVSDEGVLAIESVATVDKPNEAF